jgi:aminoglycoside phosphotransferase (APT) family kinase protein
VNSGIPERKDEIMEPDPSVYLRALRREALSVELFGAGLESGASQVIMQRSAEVLAHLILRKEHLPALLRKHLSEQRKALHAIEGRLRERGVAAPPSLSRALAHAHAADSEPSEADVENYDRIVRGLADGVRALREQRHRSSEDIVFVTELCRTLAQSELVLREEIALQLEAIRQEASHDAQPVAALPPPTEDRLSRYLCERLPDHPALKVLNVQRLVGDNSKDIFFFDVDGAGDLSGSYVMRREPAYNVTRASLASEDPLLRYLHEAGLPVPRVLLGEGDVRHFGGGFIITEKLPGAPRGTSELGDRGIEIVRELASILALIHGVTILPRLPQFADAGNSTRQRVLAKVDAIYWRWVAERSEDSVVIESAYQWLVTHAGKLDDAAVLTHGDFSLRNVLLHGDRISAILDWELCCVSHPAEDLAYIQPWVTPIIPWQEFLAIYRARSRRDVSAFALFYFAVWTKFWNAVIGASVYSGYHLHKHRNFVFASVACVEYFEKLETLSRLIAQASPFD